MADNQPRITAFLIALIWTGFFAGIFALYIAGMTSGYDTSYEESQIETFNRLEELNAEAEKYQEQSNIDEKEGLIDVIGNYFSGAYKALKATTYSLTIFGSMVEEGVVNDDNNFIGLDLLRTAIISTVVILVIIGVFFSGIFKWRL